MISASEAKYIALNKRNAKHDYPIYNYPVMDIINDIEKDILKECEEGNLRIEYEFGKWDTQTTETVARELKRFGYKPIVCRSYNGVEREDYQLQISWRK